MWGCLYTIKRQWVQILKGNQLNIHAAITVKFLTPVVLFDLRYFVKL